jgi:hypothetical protein
MSVTSSRLPASGSPPNVTLEAAERQVVPGETASFPFTASAEHQAPGIHDLTVASDNPNFNPAWARIVRSTENDARPAHYTLEVRPTGIRRSQYGTYPLRLRWERPGTPRHAEGRCTLIIKPCVRLTAKPTLKVWPAGTVSLSLENCGGIDIDASISISHHGSNWSKGWEFELKAGDGPFEFSEKFDPPTGSRRGSFELDISAEGVSLIRMQLHAKHLIISRKLIITGAIVLAGAAIGSILTIAWASTAPIAQSITFTSVPPATPVPGSTYRVTAKGGASGNPVTFTIGSQSTSTCSLSSSTVTFDQPGSCVIDAHQAANATYAAAPQAQQAITVNSIAKRTQSISFTAPASGPVGDSATLSATGGGSGNPVVFSVDPSSGPEACTVSGANGTTVTYAAAGSCVLEANQAGNASYTAAPPVTQTITVERAFQSISFTAPAIGTVGGSATLTATGGGSGNPVVFSVGPSSGSGVCSVSGTNGSTVSYTAAGSCVIDANQAGNASYAAAPPVTQTITVYQAPAFELDSPPSQAVAGQAYSYTFQASGAPAPTYALVPGAPLWLSVNATTGEVTGTPPRDAASFSYTVTATNLAGTATTVQFNVTVENST